MKKLSLLLIILMLFQITAFMGISVSAAETPNYFTDLTFHDIAYSPDLNMYAAAANDTTKGYIFVSMDGERWALVKNTGLIGFGGDYDSVVWWQEQHMFAVYLKSAEIWISSNGYDWSKGAFTSVATSGGIAEDNGKILNYGAKSIRIYNDFTDSNLFTALDQPTNSGYTITNAVSGGTGVNKTYIAIASYRGAASNDGGATWTQKAQFSMYGTIKDIVYSENQDTFYAVSATQGWKISRIDRNGDAKESVASTGLASDERAYAIAVGGGKTLLGTSAGNYFYADDSTAFVPSTANWTGIPLEEGTKNTNPPKRMVYGNNKYVAVAKGGIAVINGDCSSYKIIKTYESAPFSIAIEGKTRIEIPAAAQPPVSENYTYSVVDLRYQVFGGDTVTSFTTDGAIPAGVYFANNMVTVDNTAVAGSVLHLKATSLKGLQKTIDIQLVAETSIKFNGTFDLALPAYGEPAESWTYTAQVLGNDGKPMERTALITLDSALPEGIIYDAQSCTITVIDIAKAGEITLKAQSVTAPAVVASQKITVRERMPASIEITAPMSELVIPDSKSTKLSYLAMIKDQTGKNMPQKLVKWSIVVGGEEVTLTGISINPDTGELTISSTAYMYNLYITATSADIGEVTAQSRLTILYSDLRSVKESLRLLNISGDLSKTVQNLALTQGFEMFGTVVEWVSGDNSVIKNDGTVIRDQRQDKSVTLTATVQKGSASMIKEFKITVLKLDNIINNGGFENADTQPWSGGQAVLSLDAANKKSGNNSLSVTARAAKEDGASQTITLHNNSTYLFEAYIKPAQDMDAGIYLKQADYKEVASAHAKADGFYKLTGTYSYTNMPEEFEETVEISSRSGGSLESFYLDDVRVYEITLELNKLMEAIQKAEYTRLQADINSANALCKAFYEAPLKNELAARISAIEPKTSGGTPSGGGGSGGKSSGSVSITVPPTDIAAPDNSEKVADYLLIFKDLKGHWAKDDIEYMAKKSIVNGIEKEVFAPEENITRAEFAALICRSMDLPETKYASSFFDVTGDDWYGGYVQAARDAGFIGGSNGLYRPGDPVTREELTKMIVAAYNAKTKTTLKTGGALYYSDFYDVSSWAYDYIVNAVNLQLVNGISDTAFAPKALATRAQAVVILKRFYDKIAAEK